MFIHDVKVLDRNSIKMFINNKPSEIINIIKGSPIVTRINDEEIVIGFIDEAYQKDKNFYGNIYIFPTYYEYYNSNVISQEIMFEDDKVHKGEIILKGFILYIEPLSKNI